MATIYKILDPIIETLGEFISKYNTSIENLNNAKLEASDIVGKQDTLVSGTNIKPINGVSILGPGSITIPALTDGDKGDLTLSSSGTVWTIDNDVVSNSKLANMASGTFKGRTSVGSGDPEDMTATQATALLNAFSSSLKGLVPASGGGTQNYLRADGTFANPNEWALLASSSFTAGGTYDSGALTAYDLYRIDIVASTASNTDLYMRYNNDSGASSYVNSTESTTGSFSTSNDSEYKVIHTGVTGAANFVASYMVERAVGGTGRNYMILPPAGTGLVYGTKPVVVSSIQFPTISNTSGTIKIYGRNY